MINLYKKTKKKGEITVVTKDSKLPYDKTQLTKQIKDLDYKSIQMRDEKWYQQCGVNFLYGKEVETIDNTHGSPGVILQDGIKIV